MNRPISSRRSPVVARLSTLALLAGLLVLPVLAGCPGSLGAGPWPDSTGGGGATGTGGNSSPGSGGSGVAACDAPNMIFMPKCSEARCHGPAGLFPPDFSKLNALKTTKATSSTMTCAMKLITDPATPAMTVLMARINGTTCGEQMPSKLFNPDVTYLTQQEIECVSSWVTSFLQ
ncbi:MAG: hypothetical protein ABIS92_14595 [Polyangia bacterium]